MTTLLAVAGSLHADDAGLDETTAEYFNGLRDRRLYRLAESYCLQRLSREGVSPATRGDLTIELARTLSEHAMYAAEPEQTELWKQAREAVEKLLASEPDQPRRILLEVQRALIPAAAGNWRRWHAELQPDDPSVVEEALRELNEALAQLRALDEKITAHVRNAGTARTPDGELRVSDWRGLGARVRQQLGLVLLDQVHVLPPESPERAAKLLESQKVLRPLADVADEDDFTWTSRVALVETLRLSGDDAQTQRTFDSLERRHPPPEVADRLLAERVRLLAQQKKPGEAQLLLDERDRQRVPLSAALAFARVRLVADEARIPADSQTEQNRLVDLEERVARVRQQFGGHWGLRAELVLERARTEALYGPELASLVRKAEGEFRRGRPGESAAWFGKAASAAHRSGRDDLAFQWGYQRASIEVEARDYSTAAADLLELVAQFPQNEKAAEAHLLAAYCLGRVDDANPSPRHRAEFARVLEEHRSTFPDSTTRGEATWLFAGLAERRGEVHSALDLYREIPKDHSRRSAAQGAIARCFETILEQLRASHKASEALEREAIATLSGSLPAGEHQTTLDRDQSEIALRLARILMRSHPPQYAAADRWLRRVLDATAESKSPTASLESPNDSPAAETPDARGPSRADLRSQAVALRIVALAGEKKFPEARDLLEQMPTRRPAELLQILDGLTQLTVSDRNDPFHDVGELQLRAALRLNDERESLKLAERRRLDECFARAYVATGDVRRGVAAYEALVSAAPKDKRLLAAFAESLMKCGSRECLQKAQGAWRKLESNSKPGSEEWLAARCELCRCLLLQGNSTEACRLLKAVRLHFPQLGSDELNAKFAELEKQCSKGGK